MTEYYYETAETCGKANFSSDEEALEAWKDLPNLWCIYTEADTPDGTPFRILWEKATWR